MSNCVIDLHDDLGYSWMEFGCYWKQDADAIRKCDISLDNEMEKEPRNNPI